MMTIKTYYLKIDLLSKSNSLHCMPTTYVDIPSNVQPIIIIDILMVVSVDRLFFSYKYRYNNVECRYIIIVHHFRSVVLKMVYCHFQPDKRHSLHNVFRSVMNKSTSFY